MILMQNWGEKIFKPTIGNESVHQENNDNRVRIVNSKLGC